eukprot:GDKJ01014984.1.p1 GENE.GDKJ01014984.1~~GDKJ01014984.1.p1  ORF type:complete len:271 (-),score=50.92 GDKJ01014984.1:132-944(-)
MTREVASKSRDFLEKTLLTPSVANRNSVFGRVIPSREKIVYSAKCFARLESLCVNPTTTSNSPLPVSVSLQTLSATEPMQDAYLFGLGIYETLLAFITRIENDIAELLETIEAASPGFKATGELLPSFNNEVRTIVHPPSLNVRISSWYPEAYSVHFQNMMEDFYDTLHEEVAEILLEVERLWIGGFCGFMACGLIAGILFEYLHKKMKDELVDLIMLLRMIPARTLARAGVIDVVEQNSRQQKLAIQRYQQAKLYYLQMAKRGEKTAEK